MNSRSPLCAALGVLTLFGYASASGQEPDPFDGRIVTREDVASATRPGSLALLRLISYPHAKVTSAMDRGLIAFEKNKVRERWQLWLDGLRERGLTPKFGGMGEGSGFGGGLSYALPTGERHRLQLTGLITFSNYQELNLQWNARLPGSGFFVETSYQWRPQENYYGHGHDSSRDAHTSFALRQSWTGLRWELTPWRRLTFGLLHRWAWIRASTGRNTLLAPITDIFPGLPGYNSERRLNSAGIYLDLDGLREEYQLGGAAHLGASYQTTFGSGNLRYAAMEMRLEGRTPVKRGNSVLVGQADFELNRERGGSDPIPFYLQPHIGGSYTLRGYPLDRFYGRSLALLTLEYRVRVHPNVQFYPFFDEGQIFDRTSDLSWLNWHRNYGFGFRLRAVQSTFLRLDFGWGGEGMQFHIVFGDRQQPPLRGPVRYGGYKR